MQLNVWSWTTEFLKGIMWIILLVSVFPTYGDFRRVSCVWSIVDTLYDEEESIHPHFSCVTGMMLYCHGDRRSRQFPKLPSVICSKSILYFPSILAPHCDKIPENKKEAFESFCICYKVSKWTQIVKLSCYDRQDVR